MIQTAGQLLADTAPITATLARIGYHPEAIVLAVTPAEAFLPIHDAARIATAQARGNGHQDDHRPRWMPHVTICYSTASQPATPIIDALGLELPSRQIQISALSLVIQHGPERDWNWTTVGTLRLPAPARTQPTADASRAAHDRPAEFSAVVRAARRCRTEKATTL
jgi:2'-5' RNA ligase